MKYKKVSRDPLRAITSEMLPYEVPLPFNTATLYGFLRKINFAWVDEHRFRVSKARFGKAEKYWLEIIFDGMSFDKGTVDGDYRVFDLKAQGGGRYDLRHPYKYRAKRNNGKNRNLAIPHPQSMLAMTYFISEYRDSILYYTNRSNFSIRHPHRVARLHAKKDAVFKHRRDRESYGFEQSDLEYEYVSSFFSYKRYNNINRFYSSPEFRACERKYPKLIRADISKCFDSIYTHTLSWVTNGIRVSKEASDREAVDATFGAKFDHYMQYLNYAETSGIIIGPEFSRIFAEIILQEVDIRVERLLLKEEDMRAGHDYEIMRYVDDYFIFLADARKSHKVEEILAAQLGEFKLHLNDHKQHEFDTPLRSHMSVAKLRIRENLKLRTDCDIDLEADTPKANLFFSSSKAILDYKATLIDSELEHGEIANSYLYELGRRVAKTIKKYRKHLEHVRLEGDVRKLASAQTALVNYLVSNLDVALFVYAGAPSVSHSVKVTRLIVTALKELEDNGLGLLQVHSFQDKVLREIEAQLAAVRDESEFGVHTLLLVDCLIYMKPDIDESRLSDILQRRNINVDKLDAFGVLTFLRRYAGSFDRSELKSELLARAREIIRLGETDQRLHAARVMLRLSITTMPGLTSDEIRDVTGLSNSKVKALMKSNTQPSLFAWNASDNYHERLQLKIAQMVY
ncbi:MAG: antiviral reverse transcriptase Drt3b [Scrofimicrobium sp.]